MPFVEPSPSLVMADMPALAAQYPSVAADLKAAGLTAQQHDAYRVARASATFIDAARKNADNGERTGYYTVNPAVRKLLDASLAASQPLRENMEFVRTHPDALGALEATDMWRTP